jgi:hypothetical protein
VENGARATDDVFGFVSRESTGLTRYFVVTPFVHFSYTDVLFCTLTRMFLNDSSHSHCARSSDMYRISHKGECVFLPVAEGSKTDGVWECTEFGWANRRMVNS